VCQERLGFLNALRPQSFIMIVDTLIGQKLDLLVGW